MKGDKVEISTKLVRRYAVLGRDTFQVPTGLAEYLARQPGPQTVGAPYFVRKASGARGWAVFGTIFADANGKPWKIAQALSAEPTEGGRFWSGFGNLKTRRDACTLARSHFGTQFNERL